MALPQAACPRHVSRLASRIGTGGQVRVFAGCLVLGCDGAGSTIRDLAGLVMDDLGFTERWLVVDFRVAAGSGVPGRG
jgi:3-(3-hydroxy-phenyl)propionate hydroxylase